MIFVKDASDFGARKGQRVLNERHSINNMINERNPLISDGDDPAILTRPGVRVDVSFGATQRAHTPKHQA